MFPFLLVIFVRSPGWKSKATVLQFSRKRCIVSFLFTETNVQGSCDYLAELSAFGYHIRFSKYCLFVFLLKGLTRHRRWCSTRYRNMDDVKSLNLLNHSTISLIGFQSGMYCGELAQMVERPLCMREVPGSIPGFSKTTIFATMLTSF